MISDFVGEVEAPLKEKGPWNSGGLCKFEIKAAALNAKGAAAAAGAL